MEKVPQAGFIIKGINIEGFNRSSLIKNIGLPFKIIKSIFQVRSIVNSFKPDAAIGVGGYSSFPVLRYAQAKKFPLLFMRRTLSQAKQISCWGKKQSKYL